jgi:hypothetical protein
MNKTQKYLRYKSLMMLNLSLAAENQSLEDSLYQLICYHIYKDAASKEYFTMTHAEREVLHTLMIL